MIHINPTGMSTASKGQRCENESMNEFPKSAQKCCFSLMLRDRDTVTIFSGQGCCVRPEGGPISERDSEFPT